MHFSTLGRGRGKESNNAFTSSRKANRRRRLCGLWRRFEMIPAECDKMESLRDAGVCSMHLIIVSTCARCSSV